MIRNAKTISVTIELSNGIVCRCVVWLIKFHSELLRYCYCKHKSKINIKKTNGTKGGYDGTSGRLDIIYIKQGKTKNILRGY
jgi:hypothetical protein